MVAFVSGKRKQEGNSNGLFNQRGLVYVTSHMWSVVIYTLVENIYKVE